MDSVVFDKITAPELIPYPSSPGKGDGSGAFASMLAEAVQQVGELGKEADQEMQRLLTGEPVELHRVLLAGEKAALAFELMMSIRNKVVEAYQEVMRMQV